MIIYEANETDFFSNGLGTIPDATSALVTEERNGEFVLDVIYPQQGIRSELLTKNRIIKADAGHELKDQRFVIKKVTPTMDSDGYIYLTVHAEHVSYITADLGVTPNLTLSGNATQALEQWQANLVGGHPDITVDSDIISEHETNLDITKATNARQVLGGVEGSILDTWGGEYKFDNLHISLRGQRGTTANTLISYGRNLLTFEQEDDITDTYTSIYPYANVGLADGNNSKLITVDGYFVDSQYVDRYPNRKLLPVDFSSQFTDYKIGSKPSESDTGIYTTEAEIKKKLTELAKQYIENNRIGIPKVSTKITFADLSKTSEYAPLEQVNLCDIIPIRFEKLGIDTTIKVTRVVWNVLLDEYDSIELGDLRTTLGESISALESKTNGLANAVMTAQSTADNQNSIFRTNGGTAEPVAKKVGDLWFKTDGDYQYMYQWDGSVWHEVVNTKTTDDIAKEVDKAKADAEALSSEVESAKKQAQEAFAKTVDNATNVQNVIRDVAQAHADLEKAKQSLQTTSQGLDQARKDLISNSTRLDKLEVGVNGVTVNVNNLNTKVDNIKIGGTNLLRKTSNEWKTWTGTGWANNTVDAGPINLEPGTYTFRAEIDNTGNTQRGVHAEVYVDSEKKFLDQIAKSYTQTFVNAESKGYVTITFTIDRPLTDVRIHPHTAKDSPIPSTVTVKWRREKLEKGNVATDWSPAPEDEIERVSQLKVDLDGIRGTVANAQGDIAQIKLTENGMQQNIRDAQGNISTLQNDAKGFKQQFADTNGNIATIKRNVTELSEQLASKVGNTEYQNFKTQTAKELSQKLVRTDLNGYATTAEIKLTADGLKERYTQLNGKIDGIVVGGRNLINNSGNPKTTDGWGIFGANTSNRLIVNRHSYWKNAQETLFMLGNSNSSEVCMSSNRVKVERNTEYTLSYWAFEDSNVVSSDTFFLGRKNGETSDFTKVIGLIRGRVYSGSHAEYVTVTFNTGDCDEGYIRFDNNGSRNVGHEGGLYLANIQLEKGNKPSDWGMSDNDINQKLAGANASIAKANETIKTVDGTVATVKNNLDKTKSVVTQLANLFDVTVGDSSISVTNGGILVKGKQIHIDGQTLIDNASIEGAKIKSLDAGKITTGTLNAASVKVINLDANNIKTGTLSGNNLSLNLDDGTVSFKKGKIVSSNNKLILNIDDGSLAVGDASQRQGMMFNQGKMYMYDQGYFGNSTWNGNVYDWMLEMKKHPYAVLEYSSSFSGTSGSIFGGSGANFHSTSGVAIAYDKNVSQTASAGTVSGIFDDWNPLDGHGVFINENGIAMGAEDKLVSIVGGTSFRYGQYSIWNYKPTILVGTNLWTDNVYDHGYNVNKMISDGPNIYMQASALITDTSAAIFNVENGDVEFAIKSNDRNVIINASGHTSNGLVVKGSQNVTNWLGCQDLTVRGAKNAVVQTSQGWTKINAYETAEYYFGDLGTTNTGANSLVRIYIDPIFKETVNTNMKYQVFLTSYGPGYAWVSERTENYFVIESNAPNLEVGYEIKAKRKGYEGVRLEIDRNMEERTNE